MSDKYFAKKISLRPDEELVVVLHHHLVTYAKQVLITAILILGAFFLMFELFSWGSAGVALFLAILGTGIFYGGREFFIWYNNVFIVTTGRLIDIDQKGFWHKTVSEIGYDKILDISYSVKGFIQTIFQLGIIKIQATGAALVLQNLKEPAKINQLLADLIKEQTGKKIEIKEVTGINNKHKEQLTDNWLNQEELEEYEDYNLPELLEEYKETLGELSLKKLLVDELSKYDEDEEFEEEIEPADAKKQVNKDEDEIIGNFTKKRL
ncbi:MAG: PH domain-containing protein [Patescibacteria group bacterium]